ncbi:MAG: ATP synthase F0 subunit B [Thermoguttaceae bacterium]|nr:ATP synthase F0 subunit B [Thermoguttaceae bacterium]
MKFNELNAAANGFRVSKRRAAVVATAALGVFLAETSALWASEHGGEEASLNPMAWQTDLALWTAVVFLGLVAVLGRFALGPIAKALDERERTEIERRAALEKANADARALLDEYRGKLDESAEEARRVVAEARVEAEKTALLIVAEAKEAASKERERALKDVEVATDGALQALAAKSAELATNLAGKILKETIDPARGERLLESAVDDLARR